MCHTWLLPSPGGATCSVSQQNASMCHVCCIGQTRRLTSFVSLCGRLKDGISSADACCRGVLLVVQVAVATVDSWGRRPLLLWGVGGLTGALVVLGATQAGLAPGDSAVGAWTSVVALLLYVGCYQVGYQVIRHTLIRPCESASMLVGAQGGYKLCRMSSVCHRLVLRPCSMTCATPVIRQWCRAVHNGRLNNRRTCCMLTHACCCAAHRSALVPSAG